LPCATPPVDIEQVLPTEDPIVETTQRPVAFEFTTEERSLLQPVVAQVAQHEIFQISKIRQAVTPLESHASERLKNWRIELEDAMYTYNEQRFQELLAMV
jgi:hypothetical protein